MLLPRILMLRVAAFILPSRALQSTGLSQSNITHKDGDTQIHTRRKHILGFVQLLSSFPPSYVKYRSFIRAHGSLASG